jgi:hypothetical protein
VYGPASRLSFGANPVTDVGKLVGEGIVRLGLFRIPRPSGCSLRARGHGDGIWPDQPEPDPDGDGMRPVLHMEAAQDDRHL